MQLPQCGSCAMSEPASQLNQRNAQKNRSAPGHRLLLRPPPLCHTLSHAAVIHTHITLSHTHTCVAGTYGTGLAGVDRLDRGNIVRHCHTTLSHRSLSHTTSSHTTLSHTDNLVAHTTVSHATMSHADSF